MGASRYVGRIGGLAVALGIGIAIASGQGVASADPTSEGETSSTVKSSGQESRPGGVSGTGAGASKGAGSGDSERATTRKNTEKRTPPRLFSTANPAKKTVKSGTAGGDDQAADQADEDEQSTTPVRERQDTKKPDSKKSSTEKSDARAAGSSITERLTSSLSGATTDTDPAPNDAVASEVKRLAKDWLSSPRVAAGRAETATQAAAPTTPSTLSLPVATRALVTPTAFAAPEPATPVRALTTLTTLVTSLTGQVVDPFAGNSPTTPADSPVDWIVAAATRRELFANPITVDPDIRFRDGVIQGPMDAETTSTNPLAYYVVSQPNLGGKAYIDTAGNVTYLPDLDALDEGKPETFTILVSETTPFVAAVTDIPLLGDFIEPVIVQLYQVPILSTVLQPIIGASVSQDITIDASQQAAGRPVAFTTFVTSFDGTQISVNFFPAPADTLVNGEAPTILNGPGIATAGNIDPNSEMIVTNIVPGLRPLRDAGYNVVTWDPRGEFASGGVLQLDSPAFEGEDVKYIIDWVATQEGVELDGVGDPLVGMVGGSYGGGIQWVTAGIDPRVDAIVPAISWNSLADSLYTNDAFKTAWSSLLLLGLVETGSRINTQIYSGILTGAVLGVLTESQQALLSSSGPYFLLDNVDVPVLVLQGTADMLFPLQQSIDNLDGLQNVEPADLQMIWFCGGHGYCLTNSDEVAAFQIDLLRDRTIAWLDVYLKDEEPPEDLPTPTFTWIDQNGNFWYSDDLPSNTDFYGAPVDFPLAPVQNGFLPIIPLLGGSGPNTLAPTLLAPTLGSEASNAVDVPIENPDSDTHIVGAPVLTMTYSGIGTSRHVYAQIVDEDTGLVVGNIVTPVPVTLDGRTHTVEIPMEAITYTTTPDTATQDGSRLKLQIVSSATPYFNLTQYGFIDVQSVGISLPTAGEAIALPKENEDEDLAIAV